MEQRSPALLNAVHAPSRHSHGGHHSGDGRGHCRGSPRDRQLGQLGGEEAAGRGGEPQAEHGQRQGCGQPTPRRSRFVEKLHLPHAGPCAQATTGRCKSRSGECAKSRNGCARVRPTAPFTALLRNVEGIHRHVDPLRRAEMQNEARKEQELRSAIAEAERATEDYKPKLEALEARENEKSRELAQCKEGEARRAARRAGFASLTTPPPPPAPTPQTSRVSRSGTPRH